MTSHILTAEVDSPTDIELQQIREWVMPDLHGLMGFIKSIWKYADSGYWSMVNNVYTVSTAGWSGNEEIITAMRENTIFWLLYWDSERRGGHYVFRDLHDKYAGYPNKTEAAIRAAERGSDE